MARGQLGDGAQRLLWEAPVARARARARVAPGLDVAAARRAIEAARVAVDRLAGRLAEGSEGHEAAREAAALLADAAGLVEVADKGGVWRGLAKSQRIQLPPG